MKLKTLLLQILYKYPNQTSNDIANIIHESYPEYVSNKKLYYIKKNQNKSDKWIWGQIRNEVGRELLRFENTKENAYFKRDEKTIPSKILWELTETGIRFFNEFVGSEEQITNDTDSLEDYNISDDLSNEIEDSETEDSTFNDYYKPGLVYLLISKHLKTISKVGYTTRTMTERLEELNKNKTYASYNLIPKLYIKTNNVKRLEDLLHVYFEPKRIWKKTGCGIDTELFHSEQNLKNEFVRFYQFISISEEFDGKISLHNPDGSIHQTTT